MPDVTGEESSFIPWVLAGIATIIGTLGTAVGAMFKMIETKNAKRIETLEQLSANCEEHRGRLEVECAKQAVRLDMQESRLADLEKKLQVVK